LVVYIIRGAGRPPGLVIFSEGGDEASLHAEDDLTFSLVSKNSGSWKLSRRVHGEIRPFSMLATTDHGAEKPVLTIRNHLFFHRGKAYLLTGVPEDVHPANHVVGKRHVNRLDTFPFSSLEEVDSETWGRLRRHRGSSVGTMEGSVTEGFRVTLSDELKDIGLPLSAASYLLYTTSLR
jgi:hypothetical protein